MFDQHRRRYTSIEPAQRLMIAGLQTCWKTPQEKYKMTNGEINKEIATCAIAGRAAN